MINWYIVQTFSGFEHKVAEKLNFAIREGGKTVGAGVVTKILK